jgi:CheY-like chemotaxis protein
VQKQICCERIRFIVLTGWGQEDDQRRTYEAGFDVDLTKPIDLQQLLTLLQMTPSQWA